MGKMKTIELPPLEDATIDLVNRKIMGPYQRKIDSLSFGQLRACVFDLALTLGYVRDELAKEHGIHVELRRATTEEKRSMARIDREIEQRRAAEARA